MYILNQLEPCVKSFALKPETMENTGARKYHESKFSYGSLDLGSSLFLLITRMHFLTEHDSWVRECEKTTSHQDVKLYGEFLAGMYHVHFFILNNELVDNLVLPKNPS